MMISITYYRLTCILVFSILDLLCLIKKGLGGLVLCLVLIEKNLSFWVYLWRL